jgi:hypothetical protein
MTSLHCQVPAIHLEEGVNLVLDHLCALSLGLALAQAAGATTTIMLTKTIASRLQPPSIGIHPSTGICTPRTIMMDITIARTKSMMYGKEEAHPEIGNRASREIKCPYVCLCSR